MLGSNELDKGETTAMYDDKEHSFTMIKFLILKYFRGTIEAEGKLSVDPFEKALFCSGVGVSFIFEI